MPSRAEPRVAVICAVLAIIVAACGPAPTVSTPTGPPETPALTADATPTTEPTGEPVTLDVEEVAGLLANSVRFGSVEYAVTGAFVSNQVPRNYAAGGEPEVGEAYYAYVLLSGLNDNAYRSDTQVTDFTLVLADGTAVSVTRLFGTGEAFVAPPPNAAADGFLVFEVPAGTTLVDAQLRIGSRPDRPALVSFTSAQPTADYPIELDVSGEAHGTGITNRGTILYTLLGGGLYIDNPLDAPNHETGRRANEDELFLVLDIRLLLEAGRVEGTFKDQFRLLVDGAPRGPWNSPTGGSIGFGEAVDTQVGWLIPADAEELVLQVGDPAQDPGTITIELPAARP